MFFHVTCLRLIFDREKATDVKPILIGHEKAADVKLILIGSLLCLRGFPAKSRDWQDNRHLWSNH